jgi:hypothetical protein
MAGAGEKGEEKSFRVQDRRRFSRETGEPREEQMEVGKAQAEESVEQRVGRAAETTAGEDLPEITFSSFVIGLSTQALMHLGEIPDPLSQKIESSLPVAKQMIDIIAMLQEKTRGNVDQGEEKLMGDVLYDLRIRYVEAAKKR